MPTARDAGWRLVTVKRRRWLELVKSWIVPLATFALCFLCYKGFPAALEAAGEVINKSWTPTGLARADAHAAAVPAAADAAADGEPVPLAVADAAADA